VFEIDTFWTVVNFIKTTSDAIANFVCISTYTNKRSSRAVISRLKSLELWRLTKRYGSYGLEVTLTGTVYLLIFEALNPCGAAAFW